MEIETRLALSYYTEIAEINVAHGIMLVQHKETHKIYIKKNLSVYNEGIYRQIKEHPVNGVPYIYEILNNENELIVIEEYIAGETLQEKLDMRYKFSQNEIISIILQLCDIIAQFHAFNPAIINRDIKPSNIMLSPSGQITLLDLNAAKYENANSTADTTLLGTQGYAAPEQYGFGSSTIRTDIYAIGILMKELLKSNPYVNSQMLTSVAEKCSSLSPSDRYPNIFELKKAVYECNPTYKSNNITSPSTSLDQQTGWRRFLPPGYRGKNPFVMIGATFGYIFLFYIALSIRLENSHGIFEDILVAVTLVALLLSMVFISGNYMNVQQLFPMCRSPRKGTRRIGVILFNIIDFFLIIFIFAFIDVIIFT